jgi:hypothetical protein
MVRDLLVLILRALTAAAVAKPGERTIDVEPLAMTVVTGGANDTLSMSNSAVPPRLPNFAGAVAVTVKLVLVRLRVLAGPMMPPTGVNTSPVAVEPTATLVVPEEEAAETGPSPPTMPAMTSMAGMARRNQVRLDRDISSSFGTTLGERIN